MPVNQNIKHTCKLCGKLFNCIGFPKRVRMDCLCKRIYYCEDHREMVCTKIK